MTSPNGRFVEGAAAVDGRTLLSIEVHGKYLFYFFEGDAVVHIHFGMSGRFSLLSPEVEPKSKEKETIRLMLVNLEAGIVGEISAMTLQLLNEKTYCEKAGKLGPDPLREDADPERFWHKWQKTSRSVGALLMDQSIIAGVGNIFRAEILFKAGVHPEQPANSLGRDVFDRVWRHCVGCLENGFKLGSIITVDPEEAILLGPPWTRRYVYNQEMCGRCYSPVRWWDMAGRTVYACIDCQPLLVGTALPSKRLEVLKSAAAVKWRPNPCARDTAPNVAQVPSTKSRGQPGSADVAPLAGKNVVSTRGGDGMEEEIVSPAAAALEKLMAGESRGVEHVAEMDDETFRVLDRSKASKPSAARGKTAASGGKTKAGASLAKGLQDGSRRPRVQKSSVARWAVPSEGCEVAGARFGDLLRPRNLEGHQNRTSASKSVVRTALWMCVLQMGLWTSARHTKSSGENTGQQVLASSRLRPQPFPFFRSAAPVSRFAPVAPVFPLLR